MSHPESQPAPPAPQERSRSPAPVRGGGLTRKWGLYLIALGGLESLAVDFVSGLPLVIEDLLPLLGLLILVGLLRSNGRWQLFHF